MNKRREGEQEREVWHRRQRKQENIMEPKNRAGVEDAEHQKTNKNKQVKRKQVCVNRTKTRRKGNVKEGKAEKVTPKLWKGQPGADWAG